MINLLARADTRRPNPSSAQGFTLYELMIVVVIISVISAFAIPNYQRYVARGNRVAAKAFLADLSQRQESFFADRKHYSTTFGSLGFLDAATGAALSTDAFIDQKGALSATQVTTPSATSDVSIYQISLTLNPSGGATSVRLCSGLTGTVPTAAAYNTAWAGVAIPLGSQSSRDAKCGTLCTNSTGRQGASGLIVNGANQGDSWQTCWRS